MSMHNQVVIWIDHRQARIFHLGLTGTDEIVLQSHLPTQQIHHKANTIGSGHVHDDEDFLKRTAEAIGGASHVVIVGPSVEKIVLQNFIRELDPSLFKRIIAVESSDHPSDAKSPLTDGNISDLVRFAAHPNARQTGCRTAGGVGLVRPLIAKLYAHRPAHGDCRLRIKSNALLSTVDVNQKHAPQARQYG